MSYYDFKNIGKVDNERIYITISPRGYGRRRWKAYKTKTGIKWLLKRYAKPLTCIIGLIMLFILFLFLRNVGQEWRQNTSIGGEILIFLIPFIIVCVRDCIADIIDMLK